MIASVLIAPSPPVALPATMLSGIAEFSLPCADTRSADADAAAPPFSVFEVPPPVAHLTAISTDRDTPFLAALTSAEVRQKSPVSAAGSANSDVPTDIETRQDSMATSIDVAALLPVSQPALPALAVSPAPALPPCSQPVPVPSAAFKRQAEVLMSAEALSPASVEVPSRLAAPERTTLPLVSTVAALPLLASLVSKDRKPNDDPTELPEPLFDLPKIAVLAVETVQRFSAAGPTASIVETPAPTAHEFEQIAASALADDALDAISRDIAQTASSEGRAAFRINAQALGALDIRIERSDAVVSVGIRTQSEDSRAIVANAQGRLAEDMRGNGLRVGETQVSGDARTADRERQPGREPPPRLVEHAQFETPKPQPVATPSGRFA